jgi:hypothetical protein
MAAKIQIPDELKKDLPQTQHGKVMAATPIVMTVVATMLAGLASSEMTKAQYDRGLAAQLQSKAGDQWEYFQAKKLRGAVTRNSLDTLAATVELSPVDPAALGVTDPATATALTRGTTPPAVPAKLDDSVAAALGAVEKSRPETEVQSALAKVTGAQLQDALVSARDAVQAFDGATKDINATLDRLDQELAARGPGAFRSFAGARLRYLAARFDAEARLNQTVANVYELQVRQLNNSAERHHRRSAKFFYGMLAAQLGVIVSTFSMAAKQKSLLWSLAAAAGAVAVTFATYVYFCL